MYTIYVFLKILDMIAFSIKLSGRVDYLFNNHPLNDNNNFCNNKSFLILMQQVINNNCVYS